MRRYRADLHVHTCLSPCGDLLMSPQKIVAQVLHRNIEIIAICDHNSAENVPAVTAAAGGAVVVLPGLEICTKEEIHVLGVFQDIEAAFHMQSLVFDSLPGKNDPDAFGVQVVANERDEVVALEDHLLIGAADVPAEEIVNEIHRLGGIAIASHIDRESYSVIGQLGFIPESLRFDALELSHHIENQEARRRFPGLPDLPFVRSSDAHFLGDLGTNTSEYLLERPTFPEIRKALRGEDGRRVCEN